MTSTKLKHNRKVYSIRNRWKEIREIIIKRKSAFTVYEWIVIEEFININKK